MPTSRAVSLTNPECPSDEQVARFLDAQLGEGERVQIHEHLDSCASCRALVGGAATATGSAPGAKKRGAPARGTLVGRYVVLDVVGVGGTATVCSAYDPELDRRVAVKLLHVGARHEPLLAREAQTLAKLNHPNVATVYDVGEHDGQRFLAMELATGTLRDWLAARRPVEQVVAMLAAAGDGLVAAHRAGVVHRDFKPENVLVGDDERPRVSDFGLARRIGEGDGRVAGTPVYMAPEQIAGAPADAQADTFAFAVTLYESLYGQHPFAGATMAELAAAVRSGAVRGAPASRSAPAWLHRIVVAALTAEPAARPTLADVLARLRGRRRRRWIAAGGSRRARGRHGRDRDRAARVAARGRRRRRARTTRRHPSPACGMDRGAPRSPNGSRRPVRRRRPPCSRRRRGCSTVTRRRGRRWRSRRAARRASSTSSPRRRWS